MQQAAQTETEQVRKLQRLHEDFARRGERLAVDVPAVFLKLVDGMRDAVQAFNGHAGEGVALLRWFETPAVTLRDGPQTAEMFVTVQRLRASFQLTLRYLSRTGKPDLPIIEGYGDFPGQDKGERKVMLRIEGWVEGDQTTYWISLDFKRRQIDLSELPSRIVMSVLRHEPGYLERERDSAKDPLIPPHLA